MQLKGITLSESLHASKIMVGTAQACRMFDRHELEYVAQRFFLAELTFRSTWLFPFLFFSFSRFIFKEKRLRNV